MAFKAMSSLVPILDGTNYPQWARRMAALLINMDLDDVVAFDPSSLAPNDSQPCLRANLEDDKKVELQRRDLKAKGVIEMRICDSLLTITQSATSAYETWKLLHHTFQRKSVSALVCAMKTLFKTTKRPDQTIQDYVTDVQSKAVAVKNAGVQLDEHAIVAVVLANLPPTYQHVVSALELWSRSQCRRLLAC